MPASQKNVQIFVRSIHVGKPQEIPSPDLDAGKSEKVWFSGIIKTQVTLPVMVRQSNLDGDGQADLVNHGGIDKAVLAYPEEHYQFWQNEFPGINWQDGSFGENLTVCGQSETSVCIGDQYRIGECILEISQPRQPCWKLSRRWGLTKLAVRVQQTGKTGWYFRVIKEAIIQPGQEMQLAHRPFPQWTIHDANKVMYSKPRSSQVDRSLADCTALSESWKQMLNRRSHGR